jgi:homoserine/homoserine lactone efflux protein
MSVKFIIVYSLTVFVASITPGPSMLLALNHGIRHGAKRTLATAFGNGAATLLQAILSMAGLGAVLMASETVFSVVKYVGAGYLIYVGVKTFFFSDAGFCMDPRRLYPEKRSRELFAEAFFVTIGNPKAVIFFTALFPQFIGGEDTVLRFVLILSILLIIAFACMMIYGFFGQRVTFLLKRPKVRRRFNRVIGGSFIGMGIGLASGKMD